MATATPRQDNAEKAGSSQRRLQNLMRREKGVCPRDKWALNKRFEDEGNRIRPPRQSDQASDDEEITNGQLEVLSHLRDLDGCLRARTVLIVEENAGLLVVEHVVTLSIGL